MPSNTCKRGCALVSLQAQAEVQYEYAARVCREVLSTLPLHTYISYDESTGRLRDGVSTVNRAALDESPETQSEVEHAKTGRGMGGMSDLRMIPDEKPSGFNSALPGTGSPININLNAIVPVFQQEYVVPVW